MRFTKGTATQMPGRLPCFIRQSTANPVEGGIDILVPPAGRWGGVAVGEVVAEGVDEVVVLAVLERKLGAGVGLAVGAEGLDEAGAAGMDEEGRLAEGGVEGAADVFEAVDDAAGAGVDGVAGAFEEGDVGLAGLVVAGVAGGVAGD